MWYYVGLARNTRRLACIDEFYCLTRLNDNLIGLRNLAQAAWIVTRAAWHNRESHGAHYREAAAAHDFAGLRDTEGPLPSTASEL